ncbi:hypothetical protein BA177_15815 [Woeseia oceani]|uniref:Peptidoglycan binding-like domain-containing protein n=1 Tax=Woeseia oceani TaxID=1548547 RepID=A0A193LIV4_9GAMM|nr:hypothetical protein BA177_15815 [Woeseia oceani]
MQKALQDEGYYSAGFDGPFGKLTLLAVQSCGKKRPAYRQQLRAAVYAQETRNRHLIEPANSRPAVAKRQSAVSGSAVQSGSGVC